MKKLLSAILGMAILSGATSVGAFGLQLNGKPLVIPKNEQQPYINKDNRTMIPIRFVSRALGVIDQNITWDKNTRTATIKGVNTIKITVGKKEIQVNQIKIPMDTSAELVNGRVCVPAKYIAENLEANAQWNAKTQTVSLTKEIKTVQQIEDMVKSLNSFKGKTTISRDAVLINLKGTEDFYDNTISIVEPSVEHPNTIVNFYNFGTDEERLLKDLLKIYLPNNYNKAFDDSLNISKKTFVEGQSSIKNKYDNRDFMVYKARDNKGLVIWIGAK